MKMKCDWCAAPSEIGESHGWRCETCFGPHWRCSKCNAAWAITKSFCSVCRTAKNAADENQDLDSNVGIFEHADRSVSSADIEPDTAWGCHCGGRDILCGMQQVIVSPPLQREDNGRSHLSSRLLRIKGKGAILSLPGMLNDNVLIFSGAAGSCAVSAVTGETVAILGEDGPRGIIAPLVQTSGGADYVWLGVDASNDYYTYVNSDNEETLTTFSELPGLLRRGELHGESEIWREEMEWKKLADVDELRPLLSDECTPVLQKLIAYRHHPGKCLDVGSFERVRTIRMKAGMSLLGGWLDNGGKARFLVKSGDRCTICQVGDIHDDFPDFTPAPVNPDDFPTPLRCRFFYCQSRVMVAERSGSEFTTGLRDISSSKVPSAQVIEVRDTKARVKKGAANQRASWATVLEPLGSDNQRVPLSTDKFWCSLGRSGNARAAWVPADAAERYCVSYFNKNIFKSDALKRTPQLVYWPTDLPGPFFRTPSGATTAFVCDGKLIWWHIEKI